MIDLLVPLGFTIITCVVAWVFWRLGRIGRCEECYLQGFRACLQNVSGIEATAYEQGLMDAHKAQARHEGINLAHREKRRIAMSDLE